MKQIKRTVIEFYKSKKFTLFAFFVYIAIPAFIYVPYMLKGCCIVSGDGLSIGLYNALTAKELCKGNLLTWMPYGACGYPVAEIGMCLYSPLSLLTIWLPNDWCIVIVYICMVGTGAFFSYQLLRECGYSKLAAFFMGLMLTLAVYISGPRKAHFGFICSFCIFPLILYYLQRYINTQKRYFILAAAIITGFLAMDMSAQIIVYILLLAFIYTVVQCVMHKHPWKKVSGDALLFILVFSLIAGAALIPGYMTMRSYAAMGVAKNTEGYNNAYSLHPIKVLFSFFPGVFKWQQQALGLSYSSELDTELFFGITTVVLSLFGIIRYGKKEKQALPIWIMAGFSLLYACEAHIPGLKDVFPHIPLLSSFRCNARILFGYYFSVYFLCGITMSKLLKAPEEELPAFYIFNRNLLACVTCLISIVCFTLLAIILSGVGLSNEEIAALVGYLRASFIPTLVPLLILTMLSYIARRQLKSGRFNARTVAGVFLACCTLLTMFETWKCSTVTSPASREEWAVSATERQIKNDIGNGKCITTYVDNKHPAVNMTQTSYFNNYRAEIPAINTYAAFNNPRLFYIMNDDLSANSFYNRSALFAGFSGILYQLTRNDILSMLGIKYIEDTECLIKNDGSIAMIPKDDTLPVFEAEGGLIEPAGTAMSIFSVPFQPEDNKTYLIKFNAAVDLDALACIADFYTPTYDNHAQDFNIGLEKGDHEYTCYINAGDVPEEESVSFRIFAATPTPIVISNLQIRELQEDIGTYTPYMVNDETRIFENTKAKDIFYPVRYIRSIESDWDIYRNKEDYTFYDTAYIEKGSDVNLENANVFISDAEWQSNNRITCNVNTDQETFVAFSQCWYPSWNVYIDGKKAENYKINGIIQGVFVPAGEHAIEYHYQPVIVYVWLAVCWLTVLSVVAWILWDIRREKKGRPYMREEDAA